MKQTLKAAISIDRCAENDFYKPVNRSAVVRDTVHNIIVTI